MDAPADPTRLDPDPPTDDMPVFTHRQVKRVVFGILLCILLAAIDQTVVVPAVPSIAAELNGFGHLSWIVSAYLVTSTAATPIYGKLSDIYGRRAVLLPAIVAFVIASMLCGAAQSLTQLILARALQGLGGGGLMAMSQAAIADVVSPRERGRYQGYMAGTWGVASVAGPILGGWMTDDLSWRWIFWINLPIGVGAYLLSSSALRLLVVRRRQARIDYVGAVLLSSLITLVLLLLSWGGTEYAWSSPVILGMAAVSAVLLAVLIVQARATPEPLLPPRLFVNAVFSRGVLIAALTSAGLFGAIFLLPLYFQLARGEDASTAGTLVMPYLATSCLGAFTAGSLARRIGRSKIIILAGLGGSVLGFAMLAAAGPATSVWFAMAAMLILGFGIGVCMPSTLVCVQNAVERHDVGAATGGMLFLRSMGSALGSTMAGTVLTASFAAGLAARGLPPLDLGAMHGADSARTLGEATFTLAQQSLTLALHWSFLGCMAAVILAFVVCLGMKDLPLRSGR